MRAQEKTHKIAHLKFKKIVVENKSFCDLI